MSGRGIRAIFVLGPWAGRNDVRVRPGVHVVDAGGMGEYEYRDHAVYRGGPIAWVGYTWKPRPMPRFIRLDSQGEASE